MLGFASCDSDTDPKLIIPEPGSFVLNEPVFADQELILTPDQTFELVASQPDYGFAASCVYGAEVSLTEDFAEFEAIKPVDTGLARMTFQDAELAKALCNLHGFDAAYYEDLPAGEVFFRATVEIPGVEGTAMTSNVVSMKLVKFYHAVQGRRDIYLVGNVSGWTTPDEAAAAHYENWKLTETEIGSNVFKGSFEFPEGEATFRFYTALTGWDGGNSVGSQEEDNPIAVTLTDNVYSGSCVSGKGSWAVQIPAAGNVNLTVDLENMTVKFEVGGEADWSIYPCVYIVGNVSGWVGPDESNAEHYAAWKLYDTTGAGIYVSKEPFAYSLSEAPMFRIYTALTDWNGGDSLGSQVDDEPIDAPLTDNVFAGSYVNGKGSWKFVDAPMAGTFSVVLDTNTNTIEVTFAGE